MPRPAPRPALRRGTVRGRRLAVALTFAVLAAAGGLAPAGVATAAPGRGPVPSDFDGDGRSDVAVGSPAPLSFDESGSVFVRSSFAGRRSVATPPGTAAGRVDAPMFGELLASCDLNGDRYADLVGASWYEGADEAYGIQVLLGSADGLHPAQRIVEHPAAGGSGHPVESLACGDLDGDGYDEVALGTPSARVAGKDRAGQVLLYRGTANGPTAAGRRFVTQEQKGLGARSETDDWFGVALAMADLDGDGFDDLAVGAHHERPGSNKDDYQRGAVAVLRGSSTGLSAHRAQYLYGKDLKAGGSFGLALAAGDLTGDGKADLVVGAPWRQLKGNSIGAVVVLKGRSGSLTRTQLVTQADKGVVGASGPENTFGGDLALGDITGDHRADLVVRAGGQTVSGKSHAGSLTVLPGSTKGVDRRRSQLITLATKGLPGSPSTNQGWPHAFRVVDTSGDGRAEVWATLSGEPGHGPGSVYRIPGSAKGLVARRAERLGESAFVPAGEPAPQWFGRSLG